jgi:hypothetical protein
MPRITSYRPSPAMVVAFIALLVALGGGAYAQMSIPNNSVGSKKLKNNAVTTKKINNGAVTSNKINNGAVTSNKVQNGSLMSADFQAGQLPRGPQGERGLQGLQGERGLQGVQGVPGPAGATNVRVVLNPPLLPSGGLPDGILNPIATCPQGSVATGGGGLVGGDTPGMDPPPDATWYLWASHPVLPAGGGPPTAWTVSASDTGTPGLPGQPAIAYVVCAAP